MGQDKHYAIFSVTTKRGEKTREIFLREFFLGAMVTSTPDIFRPVTVNKERISDDKHDPIFVGELWSLRSWEQQEKKRESPVYWKWTKRFFVHECDLRGRAILSEKEIKDACKLAKDQKIATVDDVREEYKKYFN